MVQPAGSDVCIGLQCDALRLQLVAECAAQLSEVQGR
jgi:hypothetical protein